jgi:YidC/Oxa1 family membrane protein insertase
VKSWQLKGYKDTKGNVVDLVNSAAASRTGYPFQFAFKDQKPTADLNQALYVVHQSPDGRSLEFEYSDGKTAAKKTFEFGKNRYLTNVTSTVTQNGAPIPNLLAWRGGFGDQTVTNPATAEHTLFFNPADNKLTTKDAKAAKDGPVNDYGQYSFAGLEDAYFAAVFLPAGNGAFDLRTLNDAFPLAGSEKDVPHVGAAVGGDGTNRFRVFAGPKDLDLLKRVDPKLEQLVDWGWFWFLAKPLFLSLNWVNDNMVRNYGWAIILVTIAINFLLLPLKITSLTSMKKMQALQPQITAINEKYKNVGIRDPRKAEQNQEVMDLYKKHGVNPAGGCVPMLLQIPFFIAFYKVLTVAIELRGASWLWITDLSQPEHLAIRILPVAMIVTQFVLQKMTPNTSMDPAQQRVMLLMPLMFGFMFYGVASGLVLYWLTGNLVGILQQMYFNRNTTVPAVATRPTPAKRRSRN